MPFLETVRYRKPSQGGLVAYCVVFVPPLAISYLDNIKPHIPSSSLSGKIDFCMRSVEVPVEPLFLRDSLPFYKHTAPNNIITLNQAARVWINALEQLIMGCKTFQIHLALYYVLLINNPYERNFLLSIILSSIHPWNRQIKSVA